MIDEAIQDINPEELDAAEEELRKSFGDEVVDKLERLLEYRITESDDGVESKEKQRVIINYKPKKSFDDLQEEFMEELSKHKPKVHRKCAENNEQVSLGNEEFEEEFKFIEDFFGENARSLEQSLEEEGGKIEEHLALGNAVVAMLTPAQIKAIAQRPDVESIDADKFMMMELDESAKTVEVIKAREDGLVETGKGVIVAVIDGEVDAKHPDLEGRVVLKHNYTSEDWGNPHRHGTHVAGIIAGNGEKYKGMAPEAIIWSYKIYPSGETESKEGSKSADAIEDAVKDGAKVINCSWGVAQTELDGTSTWCKTVERATKLGVVVVKSAGNKGPDEGTLTTPADAFGDVIVVGASSHGGDKVMEFSSRGPTADGRQKPDIIAPGDNITAAKEGGDYRRLSGTSMAAPHVAGIAALMLEKNPQLKPWQIKKILMDTAKLRSSEYDSNTQGKGLVDVLETAKKIMKPTEPSEEITCMVVKERQRRERLNISLKNTSNETMREVKAVLESKVPGIKVTAAEGNYGTLLAGADDKAVYEIDISPDVSAGIYDLNLNVSCTTPSGQSKFLSCKVKYEVSKQQKSDSAAGSEQ